ncbi:MAG: threonylcarbamoyl-AMP synthase [Planctomycetes bacterium]|nr:threonylcarbamoyl-AMP synthase [Planctomycetota bacterium]
METSLLSIDQLADAAAIIAAGGIVAFPTETVYGLGADATNASAISKIFLAKGRPSDNPLIVHVADLAGVARVAKEITPIAKTLMDAFWPGPLTIVMPRGDSVADELCAGLPTVAIRMPKHLVALELIRRSGVPLVAPSANRSGRPSGTTWEAVHEDLSGLVDAIVCGEPTELGLESTVIDITQSPPCVLRHGAISLKSIQAFVSDVVSVDELDSSDQVRKRKSPGTRHRHYQPKAQVLIANSPSFGTDTFEDGSISDGTSKSVVEEPVGIPASRAWIGLSSPSRREDWRIIRVCESPEDYARVLFSYFREIDRLGIDFIVCQVVPDAGIGRALMDRIRRASADE